MAISHIGSNTQDSGGAQSLTFTVPAATQTDDLILVCVKQSENTAAQVWDDDGGGGNGYTRAVYNRTTSGRDQETAIYWKIATSNSEANPTFTWDSGGTNEPMSGIMEVYRGIDTDIPIAGITQNLGTNDANPPNAQGVINFDDSWVVVFHAATHDDISTVAAPSGFTLRSQVWNGTSNDHRNIFSADISNIDVSASPYTPPDWGHSVLNTTPEYHCYTVVLNEDQPILVTTPENGDDYLWTATNVVITGKGFGATQGTGKVELWDDTSGTTKVTQSIDSWSDSSIQIDISQGALSDGTRYLVVTNDSSEESNQVALLMGEVYAPWAVAKTDADHFWTMNNIYDDEVGRAGNDRPFNNVQTGTPGFVATPICKTNTHSFQINQAVESSEVADSPYTNVTNTHGARNIGGWYQIDSLQETPSIIYEEGGGVNNIYILQLPNGRLAANVADSNGAPDFKAQAYSDFALKINRSYHIMVEVHMANEIAMWIDGEKQTLTAGSMGTDTTMSTHSGDWVFGNPDGNLDTGGVDIAYDAANTMLLAMWGTWSDTGGAAPLTTAEIRDFLFREGALPEHTIAADTEANMQTAIEVFDSQTHANEPCTFQINASSDGDFELTITDQVWPDEVKLQIFYAGSDELTIRNSGTSNFDSSKAYSPSGGTFVVIETASITITVLDINTGLPIENARVLLEADSGGPLTVGDDIISGTTNASGVITGEIDFTSNQPVVGVVRKGTSVPYYQQSSIAATITSTGLNLTIQMISDE